MILQTHDPRHPFLRALVTGGYPDLCETLLAQRRQLGLPPFSHLALLRAEAAVREPPLQFLGAARDALAGAPGIGVLGPVPAPMERLAGRYRAQLLVQSDSRPALQKALAAVVPTLDERPAARKVRWSLDVDPVDLF